MGSHSTFAIAAIPRLTSEPRGRLISDGPVEARNRAGVGKSKTHFKTYQRQRAFRREVSWMFCSPALVTYIHYNPCPVAGVVGKEGVVAQREWDFSD